MFRVPAVDGSIGRPSSRPADLFGIALVVALGAWVAFGAGNGAGRSRPVLWLLIGLTAATAIGRALARRPGLTQRALAVAIAGAFALSWPGLLGAVGAPTGYANANATLAALGAIAAVGAARTARGGIERRSWLGLGAVLAAATAISGSVAGTAVLAAALILLGLSALARWPGVAVVGGLIVVSIALGLTTAVAVGGDPFGLAERSGVRGELWMAAADLLDQEPVRGIGPGNFAEANPVTDDRDLRWVHHAWLQVAAELGIVGLAFVFGVAGWTWARLWQVARRGPARAAVGAAALVVVGLHGTVDYIWHVPAVLIVAALLVGDATAVNEQANQVNRSGHATDTRSVPALTNNESMMQG